MNAIHLKIQGLHRAIDAAHLAKGLQAVPNVLAVEVKSTRREAVVQHRGTNVRALAHAVQQLGYQTNDPLA